MSTPRTPAPLRAPWATLLACCLVALLAALAAGVAHAQNPPRATVTIFREREELIEGTSTIVTVTRSGGDMDSPLSIRVFSTEPVHPRRTFGFNPSSQYHAVTFAADVATATVRVAADADGMTDAAEDWLQVRVDNASSLYRPADPEGFTIQIREPTDDDVIVTVDPTEATIAEGATASYTLSRTGALTSGLSVEVNVSDPDGARRGNHWDQAPAPLLSLTAEFEANSSTATVEVPTRANIRDTGDLIVSVELNENEDLDLFWVGVPFRAEVAVFDDDTAPEVSLSVSPDSIDEGESVTFTVTRHGDTSEPLPDYFTLDVRGPDTRPDFFRLTPGATHAVSMAAGVSSASTSVVVADNLRKERDFDFQATIKANLRAPREHQSEYFTIRGSSTAIARVRDVPPPQVWFESVHGKLYTVNDKLDFQDRPEGNRASGRFYEGQEVPFVLRRSGGDISQPLLVRLYYHEPHHPEADRRNNISGARQHLFYTFPAGETRLEGTFTVSVDDYDEPIRDSVDFFQLEMSAFPGLSVFEFRGGHYTDDDGVTRKKGAGVGEAFIFDNPRVVSISEDSATVAEGGSATFTLSREGSTTESLAVRVAVDDPGGFLQGNPWLSPPSIPSHATFAAGSATATFSLRTRDDWRDIPDDTLTVTVLGSQDGSYRPDPDDASATLTVTDNDVAPEIEISVDKTEMTEGETATFTLRRIGSDANTVELPVLRGLVGEREPDAFGLSPGESVLTWVYRADDNDLDEPDRVYSVTLLPLGVAEDERDQYWTLSGADTVSVTVLDNDLPRVGVEPIRESVREGNLGGFRITRVGQTDADLVVSARSSQSGHALRDAHVPIHLGDLQYLIGAEYDSELFYLILASADGDESDGQVSMQLLEGEGYVIDPDHSAASFTVIDTDPLPMLSVGEATAVEGAGTIEFEVSLASASTPASRRTVTVDYRTEQHTALPGSDYTEQQGTLTIEPGETRATISVPLLDDHLAEPEESFSLVLSNLVHASLEDGATESTGTGTIEDDEPVLSVTAVADTVTEGEDAVFDFTRTGDTSEELTMQFLIAELGVDAGQSLWMSTNFAAGSSTLRWTHPTEDDDEDAPPISVLAVVVAPLVLDLPNIYNIGQSEASISVGDNDLPRVTIEPVDSGSIEGDPAQFTLTRAGILSAALTVNVSVTRAGSYFSGTVPSTITFAAGSATASLSVATRADGATEDHGSVTAAVTSGDDYRVGDPGSALVNVLDDDRGGVSLSLASSDSVVDEGDNVVFVVTRSGGLGIDNLVAKVRVYENRDLYSRPELRDQFLNWGRNLFSQRDYDVTFPAGGRIGTLTIPTTDDVLNAGNISFKAQLLLSRDYGIDPFPSEALVWVRDDDIPTVTISPAQLVYVEDEDNPARYTLHRTGDTSTGITVFFDLRREVRREPAYGGTSVLTFRDRELGRSIGVGEASQSQSTFITDVPIGGTEVEYTVVEHYCPDPRRGGCWFAPQYRVGDESSSHITVVNSAMGVLVETDQASVSEGEDISFTLHRAGGTHGNRLNPLTVRVAVTQNGEFIDGVPAQTFTFRGWPEIPADQAEQSGTFTVPTLDDAVHEGDGAITLTILPAASGAPIFEVYDLYGAASTRSASVEVTDDDLAALSISDATVDEGDGSIEFTVSTPANHRGLSVDWTTADGTGAHPASAGSDYTAASGTLTLAAGEASGTITVQVTDDGASESDETFTVELSNPTDAILSDASGAGTIEDNEAEPVVTIVAGSAVTEGADAVFTLQRSVPEGETLPVGFGGAALTVDLAVTEVGTFIEGAPPTTVTFEAQHLYTTLRVPTTDDSEVESNGSVTATLATGDGYAIGDDADAQVTVRDNDLTVSIRSSLSDGESYSEGSGLATFIISLSRASSETVMVDVSTRDGLATSSDVVTATSLGRDFQPTAQRVTVAPGDVDAVFAVILVDDTYDEQTEGFTAHLSNPMGATLGTSSAEARIADDDDFLTVGIYQETTEVDEDTDAPVQFELRLTPQPGSSTTAVERTVGAHWAAESGTATAGEDFTASKGRSLFRPGTNSIFVEVPVLDDDLYERESETFAFKIESAGNLNVDAQRRSVTTGIRDDEVMTVDVKSDSESVVEGESAVFTVNLSDSVPDAPVIVTYALTGTAGAHDYTAPSGTLTISANKQSGKITIPTLTDGLADPDETIMIRLARATTNGRDPIVSEVAATVTVRDPGTLTASLTPTVSGSEGEEITFTVTLSMVTDLPVVLDWETSDIEGSSGVATEVVDYADSEGELTIAAGSLSGTFAVAAHGDSLWEGNETFSVQLTDATRGTDPQTATDVLFGTRAAVATIVDTDTRPSAATLSVATATVAEDAGETALTVTATLDGETMQTSDLHIELAVEGVTATKDDDYSADTVTLTIPAGQPSGSASITLHPVDDLLAESHETVTVTGSNTDLSVTAAEVTITDNDVAPTTITLAVSPGSVGEGDGATDLEVTATLDGEAARTVDTQIVLSVEGVSLPAEEEGEEPTVAASASDFSATGPTLTIPAGQMSGTATLTLTPASDRIAEGPETVQVAGAASGFDVASAPLDLVDDDAAPDSIELRLTPATVQEDAGTADLTVTARLRGDVVRTADTVVSVNAHDVTATAGADYTAPAALTLTIPAGQLTASAILTLTLLDDDLHEDPEHLAFRGTTTAPGLTVDGVRLAIVSEDPAPTGIALSVDRNMLPESGGAQRLTVTARFVGATRRSVDTPLSLTVHNGTTDDDDYTALPGKLTIPAGGLAATSSLVLSPTDDFIDEVDETIEIRASTLVSRSTRSNQARIPALDLPVSSAQVTITDDDTAGVTFTPPAFSIEEGRSSTYSVVLDTQPSADVTITPTLPADAEIELSPVSLTFTAITWSRAQTVTVTASDDDDSEDEADVVIGHTVAGGDYASVTASNVTVSVTDDDDLTVTVSFGASTYTAAEGATVVVTVTLSDEPGREVTIPITVASTGGASSDDYSGVPASVVFGSDETTQTFTFTASADDIDDDGEGVALTLGELPERVTAGTTPASAVTIMDDDTRGLTIAPAEFTVIAGASNAYTVVLDSEPTADVTVTISGQAGTEIALSSSSLTFTPTDWSTPQTVTVEAGPDAVAARVALVHASDGGDYASATSATATVTLLPGGDGLTVQLGVTTSDQALTVVEGGNASYSVVLGARPTGDVTVTVEDPEDSDVAAEPASLTFTTDNWSTAQEVTVSAAEDDDAVQDAAASISHDVSGGGYDQTQAPQVTVTIAENDTAEVLLSKSSLEVDEGDATGQTYTVKLATQPSEAVTVTVSGQAGTDLRLSGLSATNTLSFSTTSWETAQTVTVTAVEDGDGANDGVTLLHTATGGNYAGLSAELAVTVTDNDRGVVITPDTLSVNEGDATGRTYTVKLATQPSATVTVTVSGQASTDLRLSGLSATNTLSFSTTSWETAQTVTVTAVEDGDGANDGVTLLHTATGGNYAGLSAELAVTVTDNDRGVVITPDTLSVNEGDATGRTYTVKLATQPSATVTVTVSGQAGTDLRLSGLSATNTLSFSTTTWDTAQTVTVTAVEDGDGANDGVTLLHTATGGNYAGLSAELAVTVTDNDRGVVITPDTLSVNEGDATGRTYTVKLATQPSEAVTVTVSGRAGTDLRLSGLSATNTLTFSTTTWETAQTVTVTAVEDSDGADDDPVTLTHTAAGGDYAGLSAELAVTVTDNDRGVVITPATLSVNEGDATGQTYTVKLATQPSATVTVTVSGQASTDLRLSGLSATNTLSFSTTSWETAQTVTVTAVEDGDGADDDPVTLTHTAAGGDYAGLSAELAVTVNDNDRGVVITPGTLSVDEGDATGRTYTVKLATQPSATVTVTVSGQASTDLRLSGLSATNTLSFSTTTWETAQTVTVTAVEDGDGANDGVTLLHTATGGNYAGLSAELAVTVTDNDRGVVITPDTLSVNEGDATGRTYTVKLATQPSEAVTVTVSGQAGTDLRLSGLSATNTLTFSTTTWETAQTVTVTAVEDSDGADDDPVTLTHTAAGGDYAGLSAELAVTVTDNDRGVVITPATLSVNEGDATGQTYTVKLATQPSATVTVTVSGQASTDLRLSGLSATNTLTFSTTTWETAQTVTVTAVEDGDGADDDPVTLTHTAAGGDYAGLSAELAVTVTDNDRGVVITPDTLSVNEGDATGRTYTVKLATQPSEAVTVTVSGQAGTDLRLSGLSATNTLTFSTTTWETAQTVTVTAVEDSDGADDDPVTLTHTAAGGDYAGLSAELAVTVTDNDRGVVITPATLSVNEGDATGQTYTVKLATQPSATVTVTVSGQASTDLRLSGLSATNTLSFSTTSWETAQTVTVTAVEDGDGADDDPVTLTHTAAGGDYAGLSAELAVTVNDNDRGVVITPATLSVNEGDATGQTYTVKLATQPSATVTVTVSGQASTDLRLSGLSATNTLSFSTTSWETAQTVTVTAVEDGDGADDDPVTLTHTAAGGDYAGLSAELAVTVTDNDRGVVITPGTLSVDEGDATGRTYTVKLATQPSATVTVTVSGQASTDLRLSGLSATNTLSFSTTSWETAQTVTVTAVEDGDGANDGVTLLHTATGGNYAGLSAELAVTVTDNDRGVVITPDTLSVNEGDATGRTYTVKLATQPSAAVTVTVSGQAGTDLRLSGLSATNTLTFSTTTWETAQTVTVTAVEDSDGADDDPVTLTHTAAGGNYAGLSAELAVTVTDNDRGVVITPDTLSVNEGDATGRTYTVKLATQPSAAVTVTVSGQAGTDLRLSGLSATNTLTFSTTTWETAQTVTVTAVEDSDGADDDPVTLTHTAAGGDYAGLSAELAVTVNDNDRGVVITPGTLSVDEGDATGRTYTVKLATQPSATVTVTVSGQASTDLRLSGLSATNTLSFSTTSWETAQTVTVTAVEDGDGANDGVTLLHTATGGNYAGLSAELAVTVTDNDRGVVITPATLSVNEGDATGQTYTVKLATQPSATVTVTVSGQASTDLRLSGLSATNTLTFSTTTWETAQTVTVTAVEDGDGANDGVTLLHTATGGGYTGLSAELVVTVDDDETVGVVLSETALAVDEGERATYTVKLASQPTAGVTVAISGDADSDLTLSSRSLSFSTTTWDTAQTVTVTAGEDADAADDPVTLTHTAAGGGYAGLTADLAVTVEDDETAGLVLSETALAVDEGERATYTVKLASQPTAGVTVAISGDADSDLTLSSRSLSFSTTTWDTAQTVTVTAVEDADADADADADPVTLTHRATGGDYAGLSAELAVTVKDNDRGEQSSLRVSFDTAAHAVHEGSTAEVTVRLSEAPGRELEIPIVATPRGGASEQDYSGVPASIVFGTADQSKTFTVTTTADEVSERGERVDLAFGALPDGVGTGTPATTTVTILDTVRVSFDAGYYIATEGGENAMVTVRLEAPLPYAVAIPLKVRVVGGPTSRDWSGVPSVVRFPAGTASRSFTVVAVDDATLKREDILDVWFDESAALPLGPVARTAISLIDNDLSLDGPAWAPDGGVGTCTTFTLTVLAGDADYTSSFIYRELGGTTQPLGVAPDDVGARISISSDQILQFGISVHELREERWDPRSAGDVVWFEDWIDNDYDDAGFRMATTPCLSSLNQEGPGDSTEDPGNPVEEVGNRVTGEEALPPQPTLPPQPPAPSQPPPAPRGLEAVVNADTSVTLRWRAPDDDSVTGYRVLVVWKSRNEGLFVNLNGAAVTTYTHTDVTVGHEQVYRVQAVNAAGTSEFSDYVIVTP